ncbi:hypothetical protein [Amycolatopsis sp. BJA-103]|uniref:hypothetical protein n=1 Tax=Amycolatopsis sp. BJA-103 TaxID=1911175 RepID=UPI0011AF9D29|nr:hypothetical protein [Amycolatopsis sp. BJA-103]
MVELIELAGAPSLLLTAILIYGFAPGFALRLTILLYPKNDDRRKELLADLYKMPRLQRPFWVAEQIETAIFDGVLAYRNAAKERNAARLEEAPQVPPSPNHQANHVDMIDELGEFGPFGESTEIPERYRQPLSRRERRRIKKGYI